MLSYLEEVSMTNPLLQDVVHALLAWLHHLWKIGWDLALSLIMFNDVYSEPSMHIAPFLKDCTLNSIWYNFLFISHIHVYFITAT